MCLAPGASMAGAKAALPPQRQRSLAAGSPLHCSRYLRGHTQSPSPFTSRSSAEGAAMDAYLQTCTDLRAELDTALEKLACLESSQLAPTEADAAKAAEVAMLRLRAEGAEAEAFQLQSRLAAAEATADAQRNSAEIFKAESELHASRSTAMAESAAHGSWVTAAEMLEDAVAKTRTGCEQHELANELRSHELRAQLTRKLRDSEARSLELQAALEAQRQAAAAELASRSSFAQQAEALQQELASERREAECTQARSGALQEQLAEQRAATVMVAEHAAAWFSRLQSVVSVRTRSTIRGPSPGGAPGNSTPEETEADDFAARCAALGAQLSGQVTAVQEELTRESHARAAAKAQGVPAVKASSWCTSPASPAGAEAALLGEGLSTLGAELATRLNEAVDDVAEAARRDADRQLRDGEVRHEELQGQLVRQLEELTQRRVSADEAFARMKSVGDQRLEAVTEARLERERCLQNSEAEQRDLEAQLADERCTARAELNEVTMRMSEFEVRLADQRCAVREALEKAREDGERREQVSEIKATELQTQLSVQQGATKAAVESVSLWIDKLETQLVSSGEVILDAVAQVAGDGESKQSVSDAWSQELAAQLAQQPEATAADVENIAVRISHLGVRLANQMKELQTAVANAREDSERHSLASEGLRNELEQRLQKQRDTIGEEYQTALARTCELEAMLSKQREQLTDKDKVGEEVRMQLECQQESLEVAARSARSQATSLEGELAHRHGEMAVAVRRLRVSELENEQLKVQLAQQREDVVAEASRAAAQITELEGKLVRQQGDMDCIAARSKLESEWAARLQEARSSELMDQLGQQREATVVEVRTATSRASELEVELLAHRSASKTASEETRLKAELQHSSDEAKVLELQAQLAQEQRSGAESNRELESHFKRQQEALELTREEAQSDWETSQVQIRRLKDQLSKIRLCTTSAVNFAKAQASELEDEIAGEPDSATDVLRRPDPPPTMLRNPSRGLAGCGAANRPAWSETRRNQTEER